MSFTVQAKMIIVVQESPGGLSPMLLPWERLVTDEGKSHARMGGGSVPPNTTDLHVDFPGITTLTTLWFFPEADMDVTLGSTLNQATPVKAGGCIGFMRGVVSASDALRLRYTGAEAANFAVVWAGDA
jgi:hypothetical protein